MDTKNMPKWLESAVFYEIYPQSFMDSNGDGIGDFEGIIQKLDYIDSLGCNALWLNPCFDSPFKDAGYDVRDYRKAAPRYGTNEDLKRLFAEARRRGIRVLLDLVPGHTSEEHPWFLRSKEAAPNEYWNRYIWTDFCFTGAKGYGFIGGEAERDGCYLLNFFKCQPSLNYGFLKPEEPWQLPMDHPDCAATVEAIKEVMRFWLDAGCDGFRVDMAGSLVKNDDGAQSGTSAVWRGVRAMLDKEYPEAALVSEWSRPDIAIKAGFHIDFLLQFGWLGFYHLTHGYRVDTKNKTISDDASYFKRDSTTSIHAFLEGYLSLYKATKDSGFMAMISGNHDQVRLALTLSPQEIALFYCFMFTMPGIPFLYYGDEIGMRYLNLPTKEGGYFRTGSRTPMQWTSGRNAGFSRASPEKLYLPVDPSPDAPSVEAQEKDPSSLLNTVKALLRLRNSNPGLGAVPNFEALHAGRRLFVWRRGSFIAAVNPGSASEEAPLPFQAKPLYALGSASLENGSCRLGGGSFGLWKIEGEGSAD
jgi:maltose alpha-D-glucosyltransferase/alpha-amylase